ncbi:MAG: YdbH domain-containing protein [Deltaproteobacteria bacterium]|nr:YdbH domain-containing protein [Deltaproteobacteria bacterium]
MPLKRKFTIFGFSILLVLLVLILVFDYVYLYIPTYIESRLLPEMARNAGFSEYVCDVRNVDFSGADLGPVTIGGRRHPALSIDSVQMDYTLSGLYNREIERIFISGIELSCELKNGKWIIHGFDLETYLSRLKSSHKALPSSFKTSPPFIFKRLEIKNALIVFNWKGRRLRLPMALELVGLKKDRNTHDRNEFDCTLRVYPRGQEIVFTSNVNLSKKRVLLGFETNAVYLERFSDFTKLIPALKLSGEADVKGEVSFQYGPFQLSSASVTSRFKTAEAAYNNLRLKYSQDPEKGKKPMKIEVSGEKRKEWIISVSSETPVSTLTPVPVLISDVNCKLKFSEDAAAGSGHFTLSMKNFSDNQTVHVSAMTPLKLEVEYLVELTKDGKWNFQIRNNPVKSVEDTTGGEIRIKGIDIFVDAPVFDISGKGVNSKGSAVYKVVASRVKCTKNSAFVQMPMISLSGEAKFGYLEKIYDVSTGYKVTAADVKVTAPSADIQVPHFSLDGESDFRHSGKSLKIFTVYNAEASGAKAVAGAAAIETPFISLKGKGNFDTSKKDGAKFASYTLKAKDTHITSASSIVRIPEVSIKGSVRQEKSNPFQVDGLLKIENTGMTMSKLKTSVAGIRGFIPLKWPLEGVGERGNYSVTGIEREDRYLGSAAGEIRQKGSGLVFRGVHASSLLPELSLDFSGDAGISSSRGYRARIHFEMNPYRTKTDIDLGQFHPSLNGVTINGEFGIKGDLNFDPIGKKGALRVNINNANIMANEKKAAVKGIQTTLVLLDLFDMRSAPKQELHFEAASLGDLSVTNGKIDFQMESDTSFFIEKSSFEWCDGNVYTQAMRISRMISDYQLIFYCDRLDLAAILKQFGTVNAEGTGAVNGRLPVRIQDGKIRITDGFLYSTPGQGGTIHITGTDILTRGIPEDTVQYAQIALAREALKDYAYEWVKLNLKSEEENLVLRLQFDGKPARPLPFVYKKEIGGFAKVDAENEGSIFQGISLDVNFRVPLDRILQYRGLLDMIQ